MLRRQLRPQLRLRLTSARCSPRRRRQRRRRRQHRSVNSIPALLYGLSLQRFILTAFGMRRNLLTKSPQKAQQARRQTHGTSSAVNNDVALHIRKKEMMKRIATSLIATSLTPLEGSHATAETPCKHALVETRRFYLLSTSCCSS